MWDSISSAIETASGSPFAQGTIAALATLVAEDPATVACGLLVAAEHMSFEAAYIGLSIGIVVGDLWLYCMGRWFGPKAIQWGWVSQEQIEKKSEWFTRNIIAAVVLSRFVPYSRLPTYVAAGFLRAHAVKFLGAVIGASLIWTYFLLWVVIEMGEAVMHLVGRWGLVIAALTLLGILVVKKLRRDQQLEAERRRALREREEGVEEAAPAAPPPAQPVASLFEFWPPYVFYAPVALWYAWLSLRHWCATLPTAANPGIPGGGFAGESKSQILGLASEEVRPWFARHVTMKARGSQDDLFRAAKKLLKKSRLDYPLVAKPDVGQRGAGVQLLRGDADLARYLSLFPKGYKVMFQEYVPWENEAGIFYYRYPGREKGRIFSITLKEFPCAVGDGKSTLRHLIISGPRLRLMGQTYLKRHAEHLDDVLAEGERFRLVFSGNHCQGAVFRDGRQHITPELTQRIHQIASGMEGFYFGRFDLRFESLEALKRGEGFRIVEANGASAEATHIWDPSAKLPDAYRTLFEQFRVLFEIGERNRQLGFQPQRPREMLADIARSLRAARRYPPTD